MHGLARFFVAFTYCISFALLLVSLYLFLSLGKEGGYNPRFYPHGLFLFTVILISQVAAITVKRGALLLVFAGAQMIASVLVGLPLGQDVLTELFLYASVLLHTGLSLSNLPALILGVPYLLIVIMAQRELLAWEETLARPEPESVVGLAVLSAAMLLFGLLVAGYRDARKEQKRTVQELHDTVAKLTRANIGFQEYADTVVGITLENERKRISRELHDAVGYALTNIRMMMEEAIGTYDGHSDTMVQLLASTRDQASQTLEDARLTLRKLRKISTITEETDLRAVHRIAKAFQDATGVEVRIERSNTRSSYGGDIDQCIYRFLQEGMTNSFRHGRASRIEAYLYEHDSSLLVSVRDNGMGAEEVTEGVGVSGMRERLSELGGTLWFENLPGGFNIAARIPLGGR